MVSIVNNKVMKTVFLILHQGKVYKNRFFTNYERTRNFIVMEYPKRKFKEVEDDVFVCSRYGTTLKIIELNAR